ncbi:MAG TPA: hypothetical protein VGP02_04355 [Mycobacteriales bacterium]|jgi:hypothetical protein|nr:hypothetical protein [Mycobacteriales bacterium]
MSDSPNPAINRLLMRVARRAEKSSPEDLARTFVPVHPVPTLLDSPDSSVLYGRRGTGKTHLLKYLAATKAAAGDLALYVDLRTIGSSGGLYADRHESAVDRGTCLLVDVLEEIHNQLYELLLSGHGYDDVLDDLVPSLDAIAAAATSVRVVDGATEREHTVAAADEHTREAAVGLHLAATPGATARGGRHHKRSSNTTSSVRQTGVEVPTVKFGPLGRALASLLKAMRGRRLWLLLDEWSSVPRELQPILGDLLRRSFFPVPGIVVKIGALERQSLFRKNLPDGDYLGIDLGADTSASLDLDDFLVFRTDRSHAYTFFGELLYQHVAVLMADLGYTLRIPDAVAFRRIAFAGTGFAELVRAAEGVPRDALNIAGLAAALAPDAPIGARAVYQASREYFLRDKEGKISAEAARRLSYIVQRCVSIECRQLALRRPDQSDDPIIQSLYDNRLLHRVQKGVTLDNDYAERYDLYLVDFGCFVDLFLRGEGLAVSDGTDVMRIVNNEGRNPGGPRLNSCSLVTLPVHRQRAP